MNTGEKTWAALAVAFGFSLGMHAGSYLEKYRANDRFQNSTKVEIRDVNGDGLPDIVLKCEPVSKNEKTNIFFNRGNEKYQTVDQIVAEEGESVRDKYSEKPVQEKK